jgi:non-specific serine/threonine protein kinase/serine/threonine-protein kinase
MSIDDVVTELLLRWEDNPALSPEDLCRPYKGGEEYAALLEAVRREIGALRAAAAFLDTSNADGSAPGSGGSEPAPDVRAAGAGPRQRYRPVAFHARGGLGEVYRAEDEELHREVALKRVKAEYQGDAQQRRAFLREAEITAKLEHPGIVPVHGLEHDGAGEPCYAMRFIRGESLDAAIKQFHEADRQPGRSPGERSLALRQLLSRFVAVCNTMAYAHSRGILHRDLKPANIMLGDYGETLVVDWGLAKPFERTERERVTGEQTLPPASAGAAAGTLPGVARGTPAYMSPEQAEGRWDELGPASDLFSLGATLYALLVGRPPFQGRTAQEALQRARRCEFPPPRQVGRDVPGALEAVCLKAMAREPEGRYATALELAADVERWLADEPVSALREPLAARARRWARKHPGPVAGLAATLLVGLLGLGISALVLGRKNRELELARQAEAARAEGEQQAKLAALASAEAEKKANEKAQKRLTQVVEGNKILASVFHNLDPRSEEKEGKTLRVLLGERSGEAVKQLEGEAVGEPVVVAQLQNVLGNSLRELGHLEEAEVVLRKARRTREQLFGTDHSDTLGSMNDLALLYQEGGRYDEAETLLKQAVEGGRRKLGADHPDTLHSMNNLALLYQERGRYAEAETLYQQALEGLRHKAGALNPALLSIMNNLALLYMDRGRYAEAEPLFQQVLEAQRRTLGAEHARTLLSMNNLAGVYSHRRRYAEAETLYQQALEARRWKLGADHPDTLQSINNLGVLYRERGRYAEAEPLFQQAVEGRRRKLGADHPDTLVSTNNLAVLYQERGRYTEAEPLFQQVLEAKRRTLGADHPGTLVSMNNLAGLYWAQKKLERSIPLFEETLALRTKKLGAEHPDTLLTLANLGSNYARAGRLDDGIRCLELALATARKRPGPLPFYLAWVPSSLAATYDQANQFGKSEALYRENVEQARQQFGADDPRTAGALAQLGSNLLRQHKHADAEKALRDCLAIREKTEPDAWTTSNTRSMLGAALLGQKHYADAEPLLRVGYEGMKLREAKIPPQAKVRLSEALQRLVQLYDAWGKPDEAARWRKELDAAKERPTDQKN